MLLVVNVEYYILFTIIHTVRRKTAHVLLPWQRRESSQECRQRSVEGNMADVWVMTSSCLLALLLRHSAWHRHSQCSSLRYGEVEKKSSSGLCIFVFFLLTIKQNKTKKTLKITYNQLMFATTWRFYRQTHGGIWLSAFGNPDLNCLSPNLQFEVAVWADVLPCVTCLMSLTVDYSTLTRGPMMH